MWKLNIRREFVISVWLALTGDGVRQGTFFVSFCIWKSVRFHRMMMEKGGKIDGLGMENITNVIDILVVNRRAKILDQDRRLQCM